MEKQRKQSFQSAVGAEQLNGLFVEFKTTIIKSYTRARGGTQWVWRDVNTEIPTLDYTSHLDNDQ